MRLNANTDFLYRSMVYVALNPDRLVTSREFAEAYGLSPHHIAKDTQDLIRMGLLAGRRGRGGGLRLVRPAEEIRLGELVAPAVDDPGVIDCRNGIGGTCKIIPACHLKGILDKAHLAFLAVLNEYALADLVGDAHTRRTLEKLLSEN